MGQTSRRLFAVFLITFASLTAFTTSEASAHPSSAYGEYAAYAIIGGPFCSFGKSNIFDNHVSGLLEVDSATWSLKGAACTDPSNTPANQLCVRSSLFQDGGAYFCGSTSGGPLCNGSGYYFISSTGNVFYGSCGPLPGAMYTDGYHSIVYGGTVHSSDDFSPAFRQS
jgi:hypothetical protein